MGKTENPENSGVSEPTEGEQEEDTEGEETPVIDEENNSEEDQENDSAENQEQEEETSGEDLETAVMGEEVTPMANEDRTFTVHLPADSASVTVTGDPTTTAGQDYTFTVTPKEGYENPSVTAAYTGTDKGTGTPVTVEEPTEADGVYTITNDTLSTLDTGATDITIEAEATAVIQKPLYPNIDNDQKDKWTLTPVEGLSEDGKTYLTVRTIDNSWDGFVDASDTSIVYSSVGIAANEIEGKVLAFGVDLKGGYRFASDNPDAQVKAALLGQNWSDNSKVTLTVVTAAYTNGHYEIDLGTLGAAYWFEGYDGLELTVWADVEPLPQYSLYISRDTGIGEVEVSTDAENWTSQPNPWAGDYAEKSNVYIRITPKTGYTYTVRESGSEQAAEKVAGQDYYQFTMTVGGLSLEVESTGAEGSHSLTVRRSDTGIDGVRYTTGDPEQALRDWTPINKTTGIPRFEAGTTVYVRVISTHGYTYGVEEQYADDTEATEATKVEGKEYYKFEMTSDLTLTIAAAPEADTHKLIVKTNQGYEYETIEDILYTIKNGNETPVEDETLYWDYELENGAYEPVVIKNGETVTLKVTPYDDYGIDVKKGSESLTPEGGVYNLGAITADVTVTITATRNRYYVYDKIYGDPGYENCQIAYQNDCVKNGYIAKGTPLTFKVTSPANAKIRSVSYSSGYYDESGDEEDWHFVGNSGELTADKDGIYTIPADKIVGEVNIEVWIHDSENHPANVFVCWNDVTGLKQVDATYINTAGEEKNATLTLNDILNGDGVYAKEGTQLTFKLTPDTCYSIDKVTYDGKELSPDNNGTYKIEKIDGGYDESYGMWRKIGVSAKVDPKKTFTFDYKLVGDEGSVEADVTVKEGTDVRDEFVLDKSQKITTIAGNTLNVTVRPKEGYKITEFDGKSVDAAQQTIAQTKNITYDASNKSYTLSVTTVPEASTGAKTVTFTVSGNALHITNYEVTKKDGVTEYEEGGKVVKDKYAIADKAERLQFAVTAKDDYKPVVTRTAANGETRTEVSFVGVPAVKNGAKVYSYTIPAGALAAAGNIEINEERDWDAAKCAKVRVYEESDWQEVVPKGTSYGVETWKTYRIVGYNQWYGENDEDIWCDLSDAKVYLGNAKDPIRHDEESYPSYSESGLNCADYDGDLLLAIGQGAAGQKITVEIDAKTKITLQATPAVTEVSLKDTKAENKLTQAPGTLQSYPLTIKDAKSTDALRVEVKNVKVTKGTTTTPSSNRYVDAEIIGSSLDISTEPFEAGVTSVEATLTFINASKEDAMGSGARVGEITLTINAEGKTLTPADKITLKKVNSTIYTGQITVVAKVTFGKDTFNRGSDVEVYEIPEGFTIYVDGVAKEPDARGCVRLNKSLDIEVGVDQGAAIGKQTIKVRTTYQMQKGENDEQPYDPVQAMASIPVTVVRGIESITATSAPQIYKDSTGKKTGTAKIAVEYNANGEFEYADAKSAAPKAKKVTYDICNTDREVNAGVLGYNSKGQPMVTVKNGTVTVDKEYTVKAEEDRNQFSVRVKAADYAGNEEDAFVDFTVVGTSTKLGKIVFVKGDDLEQVWDGSDKSIPVNELKDAKAVVLKSVDIKGTLGNDGKTTYYAAEDLVDERLYTMTPAKGNVYIDADGCVQVNKLAKVVIKAATNDGGKETATSGKLTVTADKTVALNDAKVECVAEWGDVEPKYLESNGASGTFDNTPSASVIHLNVTDKDKNKISETSIFDFKLAVSGAKVVKKSADTLALDIVMTKSPVKVTLSEGKNKKEYTLINPALDKNSDEFRALQKTPSVSLKKGLKLYAGVSGQTLSFTMKNAVKDARYVVVSAQDMEENTETLMDCFGMYDNATLNPNVTEFSYTCEDKLPELKKGASIAFTFLDKDYTVLTQTTKAVKIKTTALKKSFKLDAKYTLSEIDAASVPLTGKRSGVKNVEFTALYNANNKGTVNKFKDGFELDAEHGVLKLKKEDGKVVAREWLKDKSAHKNDWTGFVEYTVTYEDGTHATFVTKITTALSKDEKTTAKKYAASAVNVLNVGSDKETEGVTYVTVGKLPAGVKAVFPEMDGKNKVTNAFSVKKIEGDKVTLSVKGVGDAAKDAATYKGTLYVVTEDSLYADDYAGQKEWPTADADKAALKDKCAKVPITVNVKKANSPNRIKINAKSVSFLDVEPSSYMLDGVSGDYYYAELPYTVNVYTAIDDVKVSLTNVNKVKGGEADKTNKLTFDENLFKIKKVPGKNALGIYVDAKKFKAKVNGEGGESWSGAVFSKIQVTVPWSIEPKIEDKATISITMPNPWAELTDLTRAEQLLRRAMQVIRDTITREDVKGIKEVEYNTGVGILIITADDPDQKIAEAVTDEVKGRIADALLADTELVAGKTLKQYVDNMKDVTVTIPGNPEKSETITKENGKDNKEFVLQMVDSYVTRLTEKLASEGKEAVWGSLDGRETDLVIKSTSNQGVVTEQTCEVQFKVDRSSSLDKSVVNAIERLNAAANVPGVESIKYDSSSHVITITGNDADQDIEQSKNVGKESTVQILMDEMQMYMDGVEAVTFSYKDGAVTDSITVKKDGREQTESYVSSLVDTWAGKLVGALKAKNMPATYGSLDGKVLDISTKLNNGTVQNYQIKFVLK